MPIGERGLSVGDVSGPWGAVAVTTGGPFTILCSFVEPFVAIIND